jgi:hypothetical protein
MDDIPEELMKTPVLHLVVAAMVATTTPIVAQGTAGQPDRALMPGSTTSPPSLTGGKPSPHEGHASTTCAKGPNAEEKNATRPECANMGLPPPKGPATHEAMPAGAAKNNGNRFQ